MKSKEGRTMRKTSLTEKWDNLDYLMPEAEDFEFITEAYKDCCFNGYQADKEHLPKTIAHHIKYEWGDLNTPFKYMIIAALLGWKTLFDVLKEAAIYVGWNEDELKETIQEIKSVPNALTLLYNRYCKPVLAAVKSSPALTAQNGSNGFNIKILAQPNAKFCRIVVYDPAYGNPGARRHLYLTKKSGNSYRVSLGGATVTSWYNEPFFESIQQAEDFIKNSQNANTKKTMTNFTYCITDKPVAQGTTQTISDLSNCVLITSDCGPAYIHRKNSYCVESLDEDLVEDIEKHEDLNPALFNNDGKLKPEVKDKVTAIVNEFLKDFIDVEVELTVQDIILTGSNASYNYTKDSDLDIHIIADVSNIEDTLNLHKVIYNAYKSAFNRKFEIELNEVPVELYVETQDTPLVSNGIYSVMKDEWVKEPTKEDIPEVDQEAIDKAFKPWEKRYKALVANTTDDVTDETEIDKLITSLYELRQDGLSSEGEYSIGNLVFKEMRNKGYLDALKELRHKVISQRLSLHESFRTLTEKERRDYYNKISQLTHYQPQIQPNGLFELYNVKEVDLAVVLSNLRRQPEIEYARQSAEKLDFSRINYQGIPARLYRIIGKISLN
jgi:predicted nucleotidyltransferase